MVFGLKRRLPAAARPKLDRDERLVAWASTVDDPVATVVVTTRGLWLPGRERLGWHEIHKAAWAGSRLTVTPSVHVEDRETYTVVADNTPVAVSLANPADVPAEVRQRVTKSVAYTAHHPFEAGGVRVVARRVAGVDGVAWQVRYDEGTDTQDPNLIALTTDLVADAAQVSHSA